VGNLVEIKGHEYLIRAISELKKSLNNVYFVIVGDGKLRGKLEALAQQLGVQDKIMWAGARPHSEIPIWMNACDLFVLPSIREGFSLVHVEAMACGKPVVATRNGGSEELINPGVGILVKPKNAQELAKGIQQALIHKWSADQIRKHSLELDWTRLCRKILAIYQNINPNRMF
jgi:glycosyltransferase involved in cell wall biosynthesis